MWDDRRLLTAIAALPREALVEGAPEDAELLWRRAIKRLRAELSDGEGAHSGRLAPVVRLPERRPAD